MSFDNCNEVINKLFEYQNGELSSDEAEQIRSHIEKCDQCRKESEEIKLMTDALKCSDITPDERLYNGVMTAIKKERSSRRLFIKYGSVAACLVLTVGCILYMNLSGHNGDESKFTDQRGIVNRLAEEQEKDDVYMSASEDTDNGKNSTGEKNLQNEECMIETSPECNSDEAALSCYDSYSAENESVLCKFYPLSYEEAQTAPDADTCSETDENIEDYSSAKTAAAELCTEEYDSVDVYYDDETDTYTVIFQKDGTTVWNVKLNSEYEQIV